MGKRRKRIVLFVGSREEKRRASVERVMEKKKSKDKLTKRDLE